MNHHLFIVAERDWAWFNSEAERMGNGGEALSLALSATGQAPATHKACALPLSAAKAAEVQAVLDANPERAVDWTRYDLAAQPQWPDQRAAELGLQRIQTPFP